MAITVNIDSIWYLKIMHCIYWRYEGTNICSVLLQHRKRLMVPIGVRIHSREPRCNTLLDAYETYYLYWRLYIHVHDMYLARGILFDAFIWIHLLFLSMFVPLGYAYGWWKITTHHVWCELLLISRIDKTAAVKFAFSVSKCKQEMYNINDPSIMTCVYTLVHSYLGYLFDKFSSAKCN